MRKFIIVALSIAVGISNIARAKEEKKRVVMSAEQLCSKLLSNEHAFKELEGREVTIHGRLSSIGDKRRAYLGNRIDSVVELVITPEPKKDPFGKELSNAGCYISCLVNVPGEQCEYRDGKYECKEITNPKLEENKGIVLELSGGDPITVGGELQSKSLLPQYSIGGHKKQIVNLVLSKCEIVGTKKR